MKESLLIMQPSAENPILDLENSMTLSRPCLSHQSKKGSRAVIDKNKTLQIPSEHFLQREGCISSKYAGLTLMGEPKEQEDPGLLKVRYVARPRSADK